MIPLPPINTAFALANQQETEPHIPPVESTAFAVNNSQNSQDCNQTNQGKGRGKPRTPMFCTHCKKTNHTIENYYFKHGFPSGYRTKAQGTALQASIENSKTASS